MSQVNAAVFLPLLQTQIQNLQTNADNFFMFYMTLFIIFMQFGFGIFEAGISRSSFTIKRSLLKTCLCITLVMIVYYATGYALAFGGSNFFGGGQTYWAWWQLSSSQYTHFWLQYGFAVTSCIIALGALSERSTIVASLVFCFNWGGFGYPIVSHWTWSLVGYLYMGQSMNNTNVTTYPIANLALQYMYNPYSNNMALSATAAQFLDLSGSGVVHLSGGVAALIGACILRPRTRRFDRSVSTLFYPHSSTLMSIGAGIIFFGMLAFNCAGLQTISIVPAGTAAMAMVNTVLSAAGSMLFVFIVQSFKTGTYELFAAIKAGIAGTVAISCSAGIISTWGAVIVGFIAGLTFMMWSGAVIRMKVDDVTDAFAIHAGAGMWGLIALAFLHPQFGILVGNASGGLFLAWQLVGICCIFAWSAACSAVIFGVLRLFTILRIPVEKEMLGLEEYINKNPVLDEVSTRSDQIYPQKLMTVGGTDA